MRPRLSPSTTVPSSRNGAPRQRIAPSTSPAATWARIRVDETVSPSTSTSGTTPVSNSEWPRSISGSPLAFLPKRKFSPTETRVAPSVSIRIREQNSSASISRNSWSKGMITSSSTPRPSITSRLISNGMISFGAASGWITLSGWGSKVSTVSAPSITWRWPTWTPSKVPIATSRGRCAASGRGVTSMLIGRRDSSASVRQPGQRVGQRDRAASRRPPRPRTGRSPSAAARCSRRRRGRRSGCGRRCPTSTRSRTRPRRPRRPRQLEAVHGHDPLRKLELLAAARPLVGALAADLDRRVGGRALADLAGRAARAAAPGHAPVSVISPSRSPVVETAPKRARTR